MYSAFGVDHGEVSKGLGSVFSAPKHLASSGGKIGRFAGEVSDALKSGFKSSGGAHAAGSHAAGAHRAPAMAQVASTTGAGGAHRAVGAHAAGAHLGPKSGFLTAVSRPFQAKTYSGGRRKL